LSNTAHPLRTHALNAKPVGSPGGSAESELAHNSYLVTRARIAPRSRANAGLASPDSP